MKYSKLKVLPFLLFIVLFVGGLEAKAQVKDDPILKACEETADQLKEERIKTASLQAQNKLLQDTISLKDQQVAIVTERADFYKKAYEDMGKVDTNSGLIIANLRTEVADYRAQLEELRSENKSLRNSRNWRTAIGFGAGFATGYFTKK